LRPVVEVQGVWFSYGREWILKGVDLEVVAGEILGVVGPNASGKTTLLGVMQGILEPQRGKVLLHGQEMRKLRRKEVARQIAVVPQDSGSIRGFTVLEVVLMGRNPFLGPFSFESAEDREIAMEALVSTGCGHLWSRSMDKLSGGERQRVLLARALAQRCPLLFLDEPTAHLDLRYQMEFLSLLVALHKERGLTIVWVSHDLNLASMVCQRILVLLDGRKRALGPPREIMTQEIIWEVFGVHAILDYHPQTGSPRVTPELPVHRGSGEDAPGVGKAPESPGRWRGSD